MKKCDGNIQIRSKLTLDKSPRINCFFFSFLQTVDPVWNKEFALAVKDMSSILEVDDFHYHFNTP